MALMYWLMSVFHSAAWLKLISRQEAAPWPVVIRLSPERAVLNFVACEAAFRGGNRVQAA
jgi:hypothetical protein